MERSKRVSQTSSDSDTPGNSPSRLRAISSSPVPSRHPVLNPNVNLSLHNLEEMMRYGGTSASSWLSPLGPGYLRETAWDAGFELLVTNTGRRLHAIMISISSGVRSLCRELISAICRSFNAADARFVALFTSSWSIWFFQRICKTIIRYGFYFYVCVAVFYGCIGTYRIFLQTFPGVGLVAHVASIPFATITCHVPGVRHVDPLGFKLCPPIYKAYNIPKPKRNTTEVLHTFTSLSDSAFWTECFRISNEYAELGSSFTELRVPYQRLHGRWKYNLDPVQRDRQSPAIKPLAGVIEAIDIAASQLFLMESQFVSAKSKVTVTLGYFRSKLILQAAEAKETWFPSRFFRFISGQGRGKAARKLIEDYAHQCEAMISAITILIKHIESLILSIKFINNRLDDLREALLKVESAQVVHLEEQWFWTRAWWTRNNFAMHFSPVRSWFDSNYRIPLHSTKPEKALSNKQTYLDETLSISKIMSANENTVARLAGLVDFLTKQRAKWDSFKGELIAHPGPVPKKSPETKDGNWTCHNKKGGREGASCRPLKQPMHKDEDKVDLELHFKVIDKMWDQYTRDFDQDADKTGEPIGVSSGA
ncbi:hypothetical protein ONS96_003793 [Cadophora gregata f. sp. sojae]|nr:hypothetical protein ONS96_003793 [Cadophora gregata f. sp. sojae]